MSLADRIEQVLDRIDTAAKSVGRSSSEITLVAVTKGHPLATIYAALEQGLTHLGENRVHELASKRQEFQQDGSEVEATWHMIGHVQSRRAADAVQWADMVHSLDSVKLARRLDRFASESGKRIPVLLELNVSGEANKSGFLVENALEQKDRWNAFIQQVEQAATLDNLEIRGLMTMAPWMVNESIIRSVFRQTRLIRDGLAGRIQAHS